MDGISCAASILAIATAGVQLSIKLASFAAQVGTAPDRITSIGNDVSLVAGLLQQLSDLMGEKISPDGVSIFNNAGLETTMHSAMMCSRIFGNLQQAIFKASAQLRNNSNPMGGKVKLTTTEKAKWPFLQPKIDILRQDLQEAKGTLMLMLQVTSLAFSKRMADVRLDSFDMEHMVRTIVSIQQEQASLRLPGTDAARSNSYKDLSGDTTDGPSAVDDKASTPGPTGVSQLSVLPKSQNKEIDEAIGRSRSFIESESDALIRTTEGALISSSLSFDQKSIKKDDTSPPESQINACSTASTNSTQRSAEKLDGKKLQMFFLKPTLQDFLNKVELTWTNQTINLSGPDLEQHMSNGNLQLLEDLQNLHAYELSVIDEVVRKHGQGAHIVSAKRTKTDISTRDIAFKELPGLQFIVQGQEPESLSEPLRETKSNSEEVLLHHHHADSGFPLADRTMEMVASTIASSPPEKKVKPVILLDCIGRKFSFPFHLCATWSGMEFLIREAFLYVEIIGPQVAERHYELLNADEQIILPHVWEAVIEPGQTISMQMWPMVEDKEEEPAVDALEVIAPRREDAPSKKKKIRGSAFMVWGARRKKRRGKKARSKKDESTSEEHASCTMPESGTLSNHKTGSELDSVTGSARDSDKDAASISPLAQMHCQRLVISRKTSDDFDNPSPPDSTISSDPNGRSQNGGGLGPVPLDGDTGRATPPADIMARQRAREARRREECISDDPESRKVVEDLLGMYTTYYDIP